MLLPTTTTMDNTNVPLVNLRRCASTMPHTTSERCYFLLIHLVFYIIIIIIVYIRLEKFNDKQEAILSIVNSNHNRTIHHELHNQLLNHKQYSIVRILHNQKVD